MYENYGLSCLYHDKEFRQSELKEKYGFLCDCRPCRDNWHSFSHYSNLQGLGEATEEEREIGVIVNLHRSILKKLWMTKGNKQFIV